MCEKDIGRSVLSQYLIYPLDPLSLVSAVGEKSTPTENSAFRTRYSLGELNLVSIIELVIAVLLTFSAKSIVA